MSGSAASSLPSRWVAVFFGVAACSWMPHWSCHYYRLETGSSFVVGSWELSRAASVLHMSIYTVLIGLNLVSIATPKVRALSALVSGTCHVAIGMVHVVRLERPFRFEVFNLPWPLGASAREIAIVIGFGIVCWLVAWRLWRER